jgi:hypothetical protein
MTFPEYWAALVAKNPLLLGTARLSVTPGKLRAMLVESYSHGRTQAFAEITAAPRAESDFFKDIFRKKPRS